MLFSGTIFTSVSETRRVARLCAELFEGYLAYRAGLSVLRLPEAKKLFVESRQTSQDNNLGPVATVPRKDGSLWHYNEVQALDPLNAEELPDDQLGELWLSYSLIRLGDELESNSYFDQGPALQFVRHLRNGVAHGNKFDIRTHGSNKPPPPAYFTGPRHDFNLFGVFTSPSEVERTFVITPALNGTKVLFDYVGPGDVLDLLLYVTYYLDNLADGTTSVPTWPQSPPDFDQWAV